MRKIYTKIIKTTFLILDRRKKTLRLELNFSKNRNILITHNFFYCYHKNLK